MGTRHCLSRASFTVIPRGWNTFISIRCRSFSLSRLTHCANWLQLSCCELFLYKNIIDGTEQLYVHLRFMSKPNCPRNLQPTMHASTVDLALLDVTTENCNALSASLSSPRVSAPYQRDSNLIAQQLPSKYPTTKVFLRLRKVQEGAELHSKLTSSSYTVIITVKKDSSICILSESNMLPNIRFL